MEDVELSKRLREIRWLVYATAVAKSPAGIGGKTVL